MKMERAFANFDAAMDKAKECLDRTVRQMQELIMIRFELTGIRKSDGKEVKTHVFAKSRSHAKKVAAVDYYKPKIEHHSQSQMSGKEQKEMRDARRLRYRRSSL